MIKINQKEYNKLANYLKLIIINNINDKKQSFMTKKQNRILI